MLVPSIFGEDLFDNFFEDFTRPARTTVSYNAPTATVMRTDVKETATGYELDIDLPGYKKENVQVELKDGCLNVSAKVEQNNDQKDENGKFIRRERYSGTCSRSFYVGEDVEKDEIKARFEDGILKLSVPKKDAEPKIEENRYIAIEG